jgi:hypothetical protein
VKETMIDEDIRAVVRDAIARRVSAAANELARPAADGIGAIPDIDAEPRHPSHGRFVLDRGSDGDGACLIEPAVRCTHCGYCQSYGH